MLSPDSLLNSRYRIRSRFPNSQRGERYCATDELLGTPVLLRRLSGTEERSQQVLEQKAQILANLFHPVIARVRDAFSHDGHYYIVLNDLTGSDLYSRVQQDGPFPSPRVIEWGIQLLDALDYLHSHDPPLVHLNLSPELLRTSKPGGIFLVETGLIVDKFPFSLSSVNGPFTSVRPAFQSPEQLRREPVDPRSDLYGVGATLHYMLRGKVPPDALARQEAIAGDRPDPLHPAHVLDSAVPAPLSRVLSRAMSIEAGQRPSSARSMRELLQVAHSESARLTQETRRRSSLASGKDTETLSVTTTGSPEDATPTYPVQAPPPEQGAQTAFDPLPNEEGNGPSRERVPVPYLFVGLVTGLSLVLLSLFSYAIWIGLKDTRHDAVNQGVAKLATNRPSPPMRSPTMSSPTTIPSEPARDSTLVEGGPVDRPAPGRAEVLIGDDPPETAVTEGPPVTRPTRTRTPAQVSATQLPAMVTATVAVSVTPTATMVLSPSPTITVGPVATATLSPETCSFGIHHTFVDIWEQYYHLLGCPMADGKTISYIARQLFEGGSAIWRKDTDEVYIIFDRNRGTGALLLRGDWRTSSEWVWDGNHPNGVGKEPPPGMYEPVRGFGYVWRTYLDAEEGPLGWALEVERGLPNGAEVQPFEHGLMINIANATKYLLLEDGTFRRH